MKSLLTGLFIALLFSGCASLDEKKKELGLEDSIMIYKRAIRWGDFATAARFQRREDTATQPTVLPGNISVTSYRQVSSRTLAGGNEVNITVQIDYYNNDTLKVVTLKDEQTWKYDPDDKAWYITTPLPDFR